MSRTRKSKPREPQTNNSPRLRELIDGLRAYGEQVSDVTHRYLKGHLNGHELVTGINIGYLNDTVRKFEAALQFVDKPHRREST